MPTDRDPVQSTRRIPYIYTTYRGDVIGWGPWRAHWYSMCGIHGRHGRRYDCRMCLAGDYRNDWLHAIDAFVYGRARRLWLWWHNRPGSRARRTLERHFPRLRRG